MLHETTFLRGRGNSCYEILSQDAWPCDGRLIALCSTLMHVSVIIVQNTPSRCQVDRFANYRSYRRVKILSMGAPNFMRCSHLLTERVCGIVVPSFTLAHLLWQGTHSLIISGRHKVRELQVCLLVRCIDILVVVLLLLLLQRLLV